MLCLHQQLVDDLCIYFNQLDTHASMSNALITFTNSFSYYLIDFLSEDFLLPTDDTLRINLEVWTINQSSNQSLWFRVVMELWSS